MAFSQNTDPDIVDLLGGIIIAGIAGLFLFPIVFEYITAVDMGPYSNEVQAFWNMLPTVMVLIVFLGLSIQALRIK